MNQVSGDIHTRSTSSTRKRIDEILNHICESSSLADDADLATLMQLISVHVYERTKDLSERLKILDNRVTQTGADRTFTLKNSYLKLFQERCTHHEILTNTDHNKETSLTENESDELNEEGMKLEEKQAIEDGLAALKWYRDPTSNIKKPNTSEHSSGTSSEDDSLDSGYCSMDIFNRRILPPVIGSQEFFDYVAAKESGGSYHDNTFYHK